MTKKVLLLLCLGLFLISCSNSTDEQKEQISQLEKKNYETADTNSARELMNAYLQYANEFPQDSLTPEYLLRAASVTMKLGNGAQAIDIFDRIINQYPSFSKLPEVYYYRAYTFEGVLYDIAAAEEAYKDFINRYPESDLAVDAQLSIKYLGMSPEEIIASFETNNTTEDTLK